MGDPRDASAGDPRFNHERHFEAVNATGCEYVFMRTTIDVPDVLMRTANARVAEHGESLNYLVNRALAHELGLPSVSKQKTGRVTLPLIARDASSEVFVTNDDIADASWTLSGGQSRRATIRATSCGRMTTWRLSPRREI